MSRDGIEPSPVEELAARFLAGVPSYIWDGASLPVPIEEIADSHAGLLVRDVERLCEAPGAPRLAGEQALSGLLLPDRAEIWVNAREAREWPARRRFTIAHELGHWCMHRESERPVYCRTSSIEEGEPDERRRLDAGELEANLFAAALLMPAEAVCERYAAYGGDFARLCRAFAASGAAMGRRLHAVVPRTR